MTEVKLPADVDVYREREPWPAEAACPVGVPIRALIDRLIDLRSTLKSTHPTTDDEFYPEGYWQPVTRAIHDALESCEAVKTALPSCRPWMSIVVFQLSKVLGQATSLYGLHECPKSGKWPPYPLHQDRRMALDRVFHAMVLQPDIRRWRPVEAALLADDVEQIEKLIARTVHKVFNEYRDDDDQLTWGTVDTLRKCCEVLMEDRRDAGHFCSRAPSRVRSIRLLADRLGCDEPVSRFEDEDEQAAFQRIIRGEGEKPWPTEMDTEVRQWLKRMIAWCDAWPDKGKVSSKPGENHLHDNLHTNAGRGQIEAADDRLSIEQANSTTPDQVSGLVSGKKQDENVISGGEEQVTVLGSTSGANPVSHHVAKGDGETTLFKPSPDFRSVIYGSITFGFTANQAMCVKYLYEQWQNGIPEVAQGTILEHTDIVSDRLDEVFRTAEGKKRLKHPAWKSLIVPGKTKGTYRLNLPAAPRTTRQ